MAKKSKAVARQKLYGKATLETLVTRLDDQDRYIQTLRDKMAALESEARAKFAAITQVSDLFTTLRRVLNHASAELAGAASYTQEEISRMSADEYREKVLVPLNMGRRV
jgi:hypothetical protein